MVCHMAPSLDSLASEMPLSKTEDPWFCTRHHLISLIRNRSIFYRSTSLEQKPSSNIIIKSYSLLPFKISTVSIILTFIPKHESHGIVKSWSSQSLITVLTTNCYFTHRKQSVGSCEADLD